MTLTLVSLLWVTYYAYPATVHGHIDNYQCANLTELYVVSVAVVVVSVITLSNYKCNKSDTAYGQDKVMIK